MKEIEPREGNKEQNGMVKICKHILFNNYNGIYLRSNRIELKN